MNFFTTFAQRRILKQYWSDNKPFTLDELLYKGTLHGQRYGKLLLHFMERLGQVIPYGEVDGQTQYIGTTDSKAEWKNLRRRRALNRYEKDECIKKLEKEKF